MKLSVSFRILLFSVVCLLPVTAFAQPTVLVFGDSLSAAYGIPRDAGWAALLQQELRQRRAPHEVVNASISGETTAGGRARIAEALRRHKPGIVILELGANDGLRGAPVADIEANLAEMIRQANGARAKVVLLGMQLPPNYGPAYTAGFRALYPRLAQRYHVTLVPFMLEGIAPGEFQADNLHPVAAAQPRILRNVMEKLEGLLD